MIGLGVTYAPDGYRGAFAPGVPRPDHGDGMTQVVCDVCFASWVGIPGDPCGWCERRAARVREERRQDLLHPRWLPGQDDARYWSLSEIDGQVWDRTRGIRRDPEVRRLWAHALRRGVRDGLISDVEARVAITRASRRVA